MQEELQDTVATPSRRKDHKSDWTEGPVAHGVSLQRRCRETLWPTAASQLESSKMFENADSGRRAKTIHTVTKNNQGTPAALRNRATREYSRSKATDVAFKSLNKYSKISKMQLESAGRSHEYERDSRSYRE
jgi:hypothetical protein